MSVIYLEVKAYAGSGIEEVAQDAITLAHRLGITVKFKFNDIECAVRGSDWAPDIATLYMEACKRNASSLAVARLLMAKEA